MNELKCKHIIKYMAHTGKGNSVWLGDLEKMDEDGFRELEINLKSILGVNLVNRGL